MAMDFFFFSIIFLSFPTQDLLVHPFVQATPKECEGKKRIFAMYISNI